MKKYHFTSIVSKDHLYKCILLYISLKTNCEDFTLFVLCVNDIVYTVLSAIGFDHIKLIRLQDVENDALRCAKEDRLFHAYCWTLKPFFLHDVMTNYPSADYFAHLDADLFFYDSPGFIFNENPSASLFLTHHRNSARFIGFYELTGIYNTGFVGCKNDAIAMEAVRQWKDKCIAYCPIKEDLIKKVFGDQRYVEEWPDRFPGVHVVQTPGANAALWNITQYRIDNKNGKIFIDDQPLVFYHYSGLAAVNRYEYNICWYYHIDNCDIVQYIYVPYITMFKNCVEQIEQFFPDFHEGFLKKELMPNTHFYTLPI